MGRVTAFEMPVDTSLFTPLQLQPRAVLWMAMTGWARWLSEHWEMSFPRLLDEHGIGMVVAGFDVDYLRPFSFFDSGALIAMVRVRVREDGALLFLDMETAPSEADA